MKPILTSHVIPQLPSALEPLWEMVFNLWWRWEPSARRLFRFLDTPLRDAKNQNPLRMLQTGRQARLTGVAEDGLAASSPTWSGRRLMECCGIRILPILAINSHPLPR
jgi:hypothetical protein